MALHKDLTGSDLHEPKGISSATSDQIYRADGSGSGSWQDLSIPSSNFYITYAFFSSSGTWSKPANLIGVEATLVGGGTNSVYVAGADGGTTSFAGKSANGGTRSSQTGGTGGIGDISFSGSNGTTSSAPIMAGGGSSFPYNNFTSVKYGNGGYYATDPNYGYGPSGETTISFIIESALGSTETVTVGTAPTPAVAGCVLIKQYIRA